MGRLKNALTWLGGIAVAILAAVSAMILRKGTTSRQAPPGDVPSADEILDQPTPGKTLWEAHSKAQEAIDNEASKHSNLADAINHLSGSGRS